MFCKQNLSGWNENYKKKSDTLLITINKLSRRESFQKSLRKSHENLRQQQEEKWTKLKSKVIHIVIL